MRFEAEMIPLAIGQRVSVLVTPREDIDTDGFDWALMANMDPEMFDEVSLYCVFYVSDDTYRWVQIPDNLQMSESMISRLTFSRPSH